jgi:hypothetical protein
MAAEEVLFISEYVRYKKNNGKLKLLSDKIMWTADGADKPRLFCAYSDIKGKICKYFRRCFERYNEIRRPFVGNE